MVRRVLGRFWVALVLIVVAAASAIAAPIAPWYTDSNITNHLPVENQSIEIAGSDTFYPGVDYRFYCSTTPATAPIWGPICASTHPNGVLQPYGGLVFSFGTNSLTSSLGTLYGYVWWLSLIAAAASVISLGLFIAGMRKGPRKDLWVAAVVALAIAGTLSLGTGVGVALEQPSAVAHDCQNGGVSCAPTSGFWGSCGPSPASCGVPMRGNTTEHTEWGPSSGWYLELATGLLLVGLAGATVIGAVRRRDRRPVAS